MSQGESTCGGDVQKIQIERVRSIQRIARPPDGKSNWVEAIQKDGLIWDNHVSDLKYWDCAPAVDYGVRSIPKTFLIGKDGKVVALDPRNTLEQELLKVL